MCNYLSMLGLLPKYVSKMVLKSLTGVFIIVATWRYFRPITERLQIGILKQATASQKLVPWTSYIFWATIAIEVVVESILWYHSFSWWCHQTETFPALLAFSEGNPPVTGGFSSQRPVTHCFDVFFDLCLKDRLGKQSRRRWFDTPCHWLWCQCNTCYALDLKSLGLNWTPGKSD